VRLEDTHDCSNIFHCTRFLKYRYLVQWEFMHFFNYFKISLLLCYKIFCSLISLLKPVILSSSQANFHLGSSNKFELIIPGNDSVAAGPRRKITVPSNGAISVKFPIRVNTLGEVPITVSATSELASDALTRVVYVRVSERFQESCYKPAMPMKKYTYVVKQPHSTFFFTCCCAAGGHSTMLLNLYPRQS